jgi:hypothetical protein
MTGESGSGQLPDRWLELRPDARLEGTVLVTGTGDAARRCDLATAVAVRAYSEQIPLSKGGAITYLSAWQDETGPAARLALSDPRPLSDPWHHVLNPEHLRAIAVILQGRPWRPGNREAQARDAVAWLYHLAEITDRTTSRPEVPLPGGRAVRVANTVRHVPCFGSDFAVRVLEYLNGPYPGRPRYPHAPFYLGTDEEGRDILSYVQGTTASQPSQRAAGAHAAAGKMLRELHDVTAGTPLAGPAECVIHGDPAPCHVIVSFGHPVALIGWTRCRPGTRLEDLARMAWTWCIQPDGSVPVARQAALLADLVSGYGPALATPAQLLRAIMHSQETLIEAEARWVDNFRVPAPRRAEAGQAVDYATACYDLTLANGRHFLGALGA